MEMWENSRNVRKWVRRWVKMVGMWVDVGEKWARSG